MMRARTNPYDKYQIKSDITGRLLRYRMLDRKGKYNSDCWQIILPIRGMLPMSDDGLSMFFILA